MWHALIICHRIGILGTKLLVTTTIYYMYNICHVCSPIWLLLPQQFDTQNIGFIGLSHFVLLPVLDNIGYIRNNLTKRVNHKTTSSRIWDSQLARSGWHAYPQIESPGTTRNMQFLAQNQCTSCLALPDQSITPKAVTVAILTFLNLKRNLAIRPVCFHLYHMSKMPILHVIFKTLFSCRFLLFDFPASVMS